MKSKARLLWILALLTALAVNTAAGFEKFYRINSDWDGQTQDKWFGDYYEREGRNSDMLKVGGWGDHYLSMIQIPLHFNVPGRKYINGAFLNLYSYGSSRPTSMQKLFWLGSWSENSAADHWNLINANHYGNLGTIAAPPVNGWYSIDIGSEFYAWLIGQYPNYGIGLYPNSIDNRFNYFYSSEGRDPALRPYISVLYEEIPNFKMPLPGGVGWKLTTECGGHTYNSQTQIDTAHTGRTYYSLDFSPYWIPLNGGVPKLATDVPIYAPAGGVVVDVPNNPNNANGWYVKIDHDYDNNINTGFQTICIHMKNRPVVNVGNVVRQGQLLGIMGDTGIDSQGNRTADGVHLHISYYFQNGAGPNGSDSPKLNFVAMEDVLLKDYTLNTLWSTDMNPHQYDPAFYPSSNSVQ